MFHASQGMLHKPNLLSLLFPPLAASIALLDQPNLTAEEIVRRSMKIAGDICVYTNHNLVVETINPVSATPATGTAGAATDAAAHTVTVTAAASVWSPKEPITTNNSSAPVTPVNENIPSSDT